MPMCARSISANTSGCDRADAISMKPSLGLRTSQQLALTPQLQQSIRLLQMSTAELEQEIERCLAENPLLETRDMHLERISISSISGSGSGSGSEGSQESSAGESPSASEPSESAEVSGSGEDAMPGSAESWSSPGGRGNSSDDDNDWTTQQAQPVSLRDHLHEQARSLHLSTRDLAWLELLIESLDDDGYLRDPLEELEAGVADLFEQALGERLDADEMVLGLKLLQGMDPAGVGARSLKECLGLQLARMTNERHAGTMAAPMMLARRIVDGDGLLESLGARDFGDLCKTLQCDRESLREAVHLIQRLNPRPANAFRDDAAEAVIPDVIAFRSEGRGAHRWHVRLNESAVPRLSINPVYAELIRQDRASSMATQLQEARWMIKNVQQRFDTILRVAQAIAVEQQAFFEEGELAMKPLVLREIAQHCELHESTVSRVTTNKFILTPRGTFELKYFFTSHVATDSGGTASSTAIRARIRQWISAEDPRKPLSDQQIADRFGEEGVQVARRTIAKYREALRIDPVSQRRKL
jgi:RNA polymerase sigma-54 factor